MKVVKAWITVDDILDRLTDEDLAQVKCAYFNKVEYDDGEIEFTMVIDEENGDEEEWELDDNWFDIYQDDEGMSDDLDGDLTDEYVDYLADNRLFEDEEKDNG